MSTPELQNQLILKIQTTDDKYLLEEASRLLNLSNIDQDLFHLSESQKSSIEEGKNQIRNGQFLTGDQANDEIEKWLGK
jgi:hypothetical protein